MACIVPSAGDDPKQAGLLGCTPDGTFRYWDNIVWGPQHHRDMVIPLEDGDYGVSLVNSEPAGYLFGTASSSLYLVTLPSSSESMDLGHMKLSYQTPKTTNLFSMFKRGSSWSAEEEGAKALVSIVPASWSDRASSREVFVMTERFLTKLNVSKTSTDKVDRVHFVILVDFQDIRALIQQSVERDAEAPVDNLQLLDCDITLDNKLCVLVSFTIDESDLCLLLVFLEAPSSGSGFVIRDKKLLNYKHPIEEGTKVRLAVAENGPMAFITFPRLILTASIESDVDLETPLPLDKPNDYILGFTAAGGVADNNTQTAVGFCAESGVLLFEVNAHAMPGKEVGRSVAQMSPNNEERKTEQLQARLEQAIFYEEGGVISHDLRNVAGDMDKAALELSKSILDCSKGKFAALINVEVQLRERVERSDRMIGCVLRGYAPRVTSSTIHTLVSNSEKLAAAKRLWEYRNSLLREGHFARDALPHRLLTEAIKAYMRDRANETQHYEEEQIHMFFQYHVGNLGTLLEYVQKPLRDASLQDARHRASVICEVNKIILLVYVTARSHREKVLRDHVLNLTDHPVEPWTATNDLLGVLQGQFELTETTLRQLTGSATGSLQGQLGSASGMLQGPFGRTGGVLAQSAAGMDVDEAEDGTLDLTKQLCELADECLGAFQSRRQNFNDPSHTRVSQQSREDLDARYREVQPKLIQPLVGHGKSDEAFRLAEKYEDFKTLAELALDHEDKTKKISYYLEKHGWRFAEALYEHYLAHGNFQALMDQPEAYSAYLDEFLSRKEVPWLAWIQDIRAERFEEASSNLYKASITEPSITRRRTAISLSKLAYIMTLPDDFDRDKPAYSQLDHDLKENYERAHGSLAIQQELRRVFKVDCLETARQMGKAIPQKLDDTALVVAQVLLPNMEKQPVMAYLCERWIRMVLDEQYLGWAKIAELLTLIQGRGDEFVTAMEFVEHALRMNESDESVNKRVTHTGVYALFFRVLDGNDLNLAHTAPAQEDLIREPDQCAFTENDAEVVRRSAEGLTTEQLENLIQEYEAENEQLKQYIQSARIRDWCVEVRRLAMENIAAQRQILDSDAEMARLAMENFAAQTEILDSDVEMAE
ncbi:hypothetical protein HK104_003327 [Borealophlyctis nickersoniae]|nr:hypothetical protein HK104_003327 [Borealophlyctis nickersoniae]